MSTTFVSPAEVASSDSTLQSRLTRLRRLAAAGAAAAVAVTLAFDGGALVVLLLVFVVVVPFEKLFPRHRQRVRRPRVGTDIAYALVSAPLAAAGLVLGVFLGVVSLLWIPGLLLRPLVLALPPGARVVVGLLLFEMVLYWAHRCAHEVPLLWRFHRIHHSAEHLDWVSGFRSHPFDGVLFAPPFVLLVAAGFDPQATGALVVVQVLAGVFLHANVRWRLRPLQRVIATPEFHHWHHTNEPDAHHTNYSALLPIWDQIFGTFRVPRDQRPSRYGVDGGVSPGLLGQLVDPFRGTRNPLRRRRPHVVVTATGARFVHSR